MNTSDEKTNCLTTPWFASVDGTERARLVCCDCKIGDQEPYFACGTQIDRDGEVNTQGCPSTDFGVRFPELARFARWHMTFVESGPMHYVPNARYWWAVHLGLAPTPDYQRTPPLDCFKSTVIFGAVEGDALPSSDDGATPIVTDGLGRYSARSTVDAVVAAWCSARFQALMESFRADRAALAEIARPTIEDDTDPSLVKLCKSLDIGVDVEADDNAERPEGMDRAQGWCVTLRLGRRKLVTSYFTGSGFGREPTAADVLSSLVLDASCGEQSFENYCSDFGINDSKKAETTWRACKRTAPRLRKFLGAHYDAVVEAAQDY